MVEPGHMVAHFRIVRLLGEGGMGRVFLARDTRLGRKVALKFVHPRRLATAGAAERFLQEARVTARFNHPNIVTVHAVGEHDGMPWVALEYVEGRTLRQRLTDDGPPSLAEICRIMLPMARALAEAARHGVLHRDVKPENVLLGEDGRLRVVDFGLAHEAEASDADPDPQADATRGVSGTPGYLAPERWRGEDGTHATDVWALGVMLHELLCGQRPFARLEASPRLLSMALQQPSKALDLTDANERSVTLARLVTRCLALSPADRPTAVELADELAALIQPATRRTGDERSPYPGLAAFSEEDAVFFFGRTAEVDAFVERLRTVPVLPIVGPSGAGKSSFLAGGVIPRIRELGDWRVLRIRPGPDPFGALADALVARPASTTGSTTRVTTVPTGSIWDAETGEGLPRTAPSLDASGLAEQLRANPQTLALRLAECAGLGRVLLAVDQLEELYTHVADEAVRDAFMTALCSAADDPAEPVRVVFTLRDDFLGRLALGERARKALQQVTLLRPLGRDAMREILAGPLHVVGYTWDDPALPDEMLDAIAHDPAALPLLAFTCRLLWERRDTRRRVLRRSDYVACGGVGGALADHADGVLDRLSPTEQATARDLLLTLVTADNTRRIVPRDRLLDAGGAEAEGVLDALISARLITSRRPRDDSASAVVELTHEAIIAHWTRLHRWIDESKGDRTALEQLEQAAALWLERGKRPEEVWAGPALRDAQALVARTASTVSPAGLDFLVEAEAREQAATRRRRLLRIGGALTTALVVVVALSIALVLGRSATRERAARADAERSMDEAEQRRAQAELEAAGAALTRNSYLEARARLRASLELRDSALARGLWLELSRSAEQWRLQRPDHVGRTCWSPAGEQIASVSSDRTVQLVDPTLATTRSLRGHTDQVRICTFSPDGTRLATAGRGGELRIWDLATGRSVDISDRRDSASGIAWSRPGFLALGALSDVRVWRDGDLDAAPRTIEVGGRVKEVALSPTAPLLAVATGVKAQTIFLFDAETGEPLRAMAPKAGSVSTVTFDATGKTLAASFADTRIRLYDAGSGALVTTLTGAEGYLTDLGFTPDGRTIVAAGQDAWVHVFDRTTGGIRRIGRHDEQVTSVGVAPTGDRVVTASHDGTLRVWRLDLDTAPVGAAGGHGASTIPVAFSADSQTVVSGDVEGGIELRDVSTGERTRRLAGHLGRVTGLAFGADGALLSASDDLTVRRWDTGLGTYRILGVHATEITSADLTADRQTFVTRSPQGEVHLWDLATGASRPPFGQGTGWGLDVAISPDGARVASAAGSVVRLVDPETSRAVASLGGHQGSIIGVDFDSTGRHLASVADDGHVLWHTLDPPAHRSLGRAPPRGYWLDVRPDDAQVAVPCADRNVRLFAVDGEAPPIVMPGHRGEVNQTRYSPDGRFVASTSDDGTVRLWRADDGRPVWRTVGLVAGGVRTHRGWFTPGGAASANAPAAWATVLGRDVARSSATLDGGAVCLSTNDGRVTLAGAHAAPLELPVESAATDLYAVGTTQRPGCVVRTSTGLTLHRPGAPPRALSPEARFAGGSAGAFWLLEVESAHEIPLEGDSGRTVRVGVGATAVTSVGRAVLVGYRDGAIERVDDTNAPAARIFEAGSVAAITRLAAGPAGTLAVGTARGRVAIWGLQEGRELVALKLHGAITHIVVGADAVLAASELGEHTRIPLDAFTRPWCDLLRAVWEDVPIGWEGGRALRRPPPEDHRCGR